MLGSKLFFDFVIPPSLTKQGWRLTGVDPKDSAKAWSAQFDQGSVSGKVDLSAMNHSYTPPSGPTGAGGATTDNTYDVPGGTVSLGISGMTNP